MSLLLCFRSHPPRAICNSISIHLLPLSLILVSIVSWLLSIILLLGLLHLSCCKLLLLIYALMQLLSSLLILENSCIKISSHVIIVLLVHYDSIALVLTNILLLSIKLVLVGICCDVLSKLSV